MSALKTNYISHVSSQNIATILNNSKYYLIAGFAGYLAKSLIDEHYSFSCTYDFENKTFSFSCNHS